MTDLIRHVPLPPLIYLSAIALATVLGIALPLPWIGSPLADILFAVGWLLLLGFAALMWRSIAALRKAGTTVDPNGQPVHLVTTGPFGISRNPIYLADALLVIGLGLIIGNPWFLILTVPASFLTRRLAIDREEKLLFERFGKRYRDYTRRVRRWL